MYKVPKGPDSRDSSVPPPPGFLVSPKAGIGGLAFAFVLLIGAFAAMGIYGMGSDDEPESVTLPRIEMQNVGEGELAEILPEEVSRKLQDELFTWFRANDRSPISDREPVAEQEWVDHLLSGDVRVRLDRLPPRVFGGLDNVPRVIDEPGPYRGALVRVWARVDTITEIQLDFSGSTQTAWRLSSVDANGVPWIITCTSAPPSEVESGSWVKVYGVFTKLWPLADRHEPAFHALSGRRIVASFAPATNRRPQLEWLEQVRDFTPEESEKLEDEPFYGMLNYVRTLGPEGYRELRDSGEIDVIDLTGSAGATELSEKPQAWRFTPVRLRVAPLLDEFVVDSYIPENPGNIEFVYRGFVVDDQTRPIWFITPFRKGQFDLQESRIVEVEGFFYKRKHVRTATGKRYWMPIVIGADVRPVELGNVGGPTSLTVVLGVVVVGSIIMLFVFLFVWRKERLRELETRRRVAERRGHGRSPSL